MKITWEVDGATVTANALEDGLEDGMEDAVEKILEHLEREAKNKISVRPSVFTGEVYESFDDQTGSAHSASGISSRFINYAKHAGALEHGVHESKYADGAPPIEALMPWVLEKLQGWNIDDYDGGGGGASVKTPTPGDDNDPTNTPSGSTADYDSDWKQFHKNGFDVDNLWEGQRVTVYNGSANEYQPATVKSINLIGSVAVETDDGKHLALKWNTGVPSSGIVAGEDWNSLTESQQRSIAKDMLLDVDIDSDFSSSYRSDIEDVLTEYGDRLKDPTEVKHLSIGINKVKKDNSLSALGQWLGSKQGGRVDFNTNKADKDTIRHEFGHAYKEAVLKLNYNTGARHTDLSKGERWDSVAKHKSGGLDWNYHDIGPSRWETQKGNPLPHPTTYMTYSDEKRRGVGLYDDVQHDAFDSWEEAVRKRVVYETQDGSATIPNYDPFWTERKFLDPERSPAKEGSAMHFAYEKDGKYKDFHVTLKSGVYEKDGDYFVDIEHDGTEKTIPITENGELKPSEFVFYGALPSGKDDNLEKSEIPNDPGFYHNSDEERERFREAVNRELWREMIASEIASSNSNSNAADWYMRWDGYSGTNSHEIVAHLMSIIFSEDKLNSSDKQNLEQLLDRSPELLFMANQKTDFSPEMVKVLEDESGVSFDDLMFDIWREHVK